jgi:tetratricopeptide (TPR) repeat protein
MNRLVVILGILLVASVGALGLYWQRSQAFNHQLTEARAAVGTRHGTELLHRLAERYPDNGELQFLHARQLRLDQHPDRALDALHLAAQLGWPRPQVDRELLLVRALTEFSQAEPKLQALLDSDPDDRDVNLSLAFGYSRGRQVKKAEALVNSVLEKDPDDGLALCLRGRLRLQKGQPHEARPDLEKTVRLGGDRSYVGDARLLLANCLLEVGNFEGALRLFRECEVEEPDNPRVLFGAGRAAWYLNRWTEAEAAFRSVLRVQPDHLDALSQLAYIHEERGERGEALRLLEEAAKQDPAWYELHVRIAKILLAQGQPERAAEHRRRAEELKKYWARPRPTSDTTRNPYTGDEPGSRRSRDEGLSSGEIR